LGTSVLRYDGQVLAVEDVQVGDLLMGPDSRPRRVLSVARAAGPLFRIVPVKGESWTCNDVHVLTIVRSDTGRVCDVPLDRWLRWSGYARHMSKLFQPPQGIDFAPCRIPIVPGYFIGLWLGDGTKALRGVAISNPDAEVFAECQRVAAM